MGIVKLKNIACCAKTGLFLFLFTFHTSQIVTSLSGIPKFPNLFEITSNSQWNKRGSEPYYLFLECITIFLFLAPTCSRLPLLRREPIGWKHWRFVLIIDCLTTQECLCS